jgi:hypothetical protein
MEHGEGTFAIFVKEIKGQACSPCKFRTSRYLLVGYIMYLVNSLIISHLEVENVKRKFDLRITK